MGFIRSNLGLVRRLRAKLGERLYKLQLPDGSEMTYTSEDLLDAVGAAIEREEHWLKSGLEQTEGDTGLEGLVRALGSSYAQVEAEEE